MKRIKQKIDLKNIQKMQEIAERMLDNHLMTDVKMKQISQVLSKLYTIEKDMLYEIYKEDGIMGKELRLDSTSSC